jgi:hypothetical protein
MRMKAQRNNNETTVLINPGWIGIKFVPSLPKAVKRVRLAYSALYSPACTAQA